MGDSDNLWLKSLNTKNNFTTKYAAETLGWIYDKLGYIAADDFITERRISRNYYKDHGAYLDFDQNEFFDVDFGTSEFSGREQGKIYIPNQCYEPGIICRVHFAFHRNN